jgi:hypothetical protein
MKNAESVSALMQATQAAGTSAGGTGMTTAAAGSVQNDINALGQALQSGDTSSAQKLLAQLEQDLQASGQSATGRHGHHHHHAGLDTSLLTAAAAGTTGTTASDGASATAS